MSQICKFLKTEVDGWLREPRKKWGVISDRYEVVKIDMMIAQLCKYTKNTELPNKKRRKSQKQQSKPQVT